MNNERVSANRPHILWLDVARVFAIISITCNHAANRVWSNYSGQRAEYLTLGLGSTVLKTLLFVFSRLGVPLFLMITGALLLKKRYDSAEDVHRFYRHSLLRLVVTAEIWYGIMFWFILLWDPKNTLLQTMSAGELLWGMVKNGLFLDQVTLGSMWYMPMILCLYLMLPFASIVRERISWKGTALALGMLVLIKMGIPSYNGLMNLLENGKTVSFALNGANLFSMYFIYVVAGDWIARGGMKKLPAWTVFCGVALCFAGTAVFQLWAFSKPLDYVVDYDFILLLPCTLCLFELIRRFGDSLQRLRSPIEYLSRISFGIYFVHVLIVWALYWYVDCSSMSHTAWFLFLELVPVLGSVVIIAVLSKIPACRRYLFMIH